MQAICVVRLLRTGSPRVRKLALRLSVHVCAAFAPSELDEVYAECCPEDPPLKSRTFLQILVETIASGFAPSFQHSNKSSDGQDELCHGAGEGYVLSGLAVATCNVLRTLLNGGLRDSQLQWRAVVLGWIRHELEEGLELLQKEPTSRSTQDSVSNNEAIAASS